MNDEAITQRLDALERTMKERQAGQMEIRKWLVGIVIGIFTQVFVFVGYIVSDHYKLQVIDSNFGPLAKQVNDMYIRSEVREALQKQKQQ